MLGLGLLYYSIEIMTLQRMTMLSRLLVLAVGGMSPCTTGLEAPARGKSFTEVAKVRLPLRCAVFLLLHLLAGPSVI
jgi:hypothetical protein